LNATSSNATPPVRGEKVLSTIRSVTMWAARTGPLIGANALAGLVASLLTIAYCLSFSALLFQGDLKSGLAAGLWGLLVGSAIAGIYVSLTTSLPPAEAGPDNPAVAVLSVLAGSVSAQVIAAGGSTALAVDYVLLSFSIATLVTGIVLYLLGALKLGQIVRFIPYPVIGGFLAASGWLLATGGIEVITGKDFALVDLAGSVPSSALPKVLLGAVFAIVIYAVKVRTGSFYVLPIAFFGGSLVLDLGLWSQDLMHEGSGWYISGSSELEPWVPIKTALEIGIDWSIFLHAAAEIGAVAGVTVICLLLDVTGLEVARTRSADLDWEFRSNGLANILAAPLGGLMGNLSLNGSRLLDETGGLARISGVFASLVVVLVVLTGLDLPHIVPAPILAGLLMYLGLVVLTEVLLRSPAHRAWTDFALALLIMVVIVEAGYLAGVVFGFIAACLMFAFSYSRIAVIRRHLTRVVFASNMDRSASASRLLQEEGDRIHVFWLSGFIFFGSSNGVFEDIRDAVSNKPGGRRCYAVLDLSDVSGFDTSALLSMMKLRNHCDDHNVTLAFAGLSTRMLTALEHMHLFGSGRPHRAFATRNEALEWCEDQVLAESKAEERSGTAADFEDWLAGETGGRDRARNLARYFERRDLAAGTVLYRQGEPSDTIDLVVNGTIAVAIMSDPGLELLIRRMSTRTVVGEMGFFRGSSRVATVSAEQRATIYTLTRANYVRMKAEQPELGAAFLEFIVRALSDRLEFANQGIAALS
jgi:SulP family sulfate permease